jgi:hypothetical protein
MWRIFRVEFPEYQEDATSSATIQVHNNKDKDGIKNNGQLTKVSPQVTIIILLIPSSHP